jgi:hypothetical protein
VKPLLDFDLNSEKALRLSMSEDLKAVDLRTKPDEPRPRAAEACQGQHRRLGALQKAEWFVAALNESPALARSRILFWTMACPVYIRLRQHCIPSTLAADTPVA